ncbi:unnamed protein product [Pleuronectes platessa]|uniref:Uncharacterized protein n=1 Tax=Pleuronectes platessa TaxID=8262 RepID=A0A9N7W0S2_PLEPL|nr:unnamed protein product [Pleuronectes platessa]
MSSGCPLDVLSSQSNSGKRQRREIRGSHRSTLRTFSYVAHGSKYKITVHAAESSPLRASRHPPCGPARLPPRTPCPLMLPSVVFSTLNLTRFSKNKAPRADLRFHPGITEGGF